MRTRVLCLLLVALPCAVGVGCGSSEESDWRTDPNRVFDRAMQAVHDGDWKGLQPLLTKKARFALERDLTRMRRRLAHDVDGKQERRIARELLGTEYDAAIARVTTGDLAEVLRFFVRLSPRAAKPPTGQRRFAKFQVDILYANAEGTLRPVRLVRLPAGWFVDELQL